MFSLCKVGFSLEKQQQYDRIKGIKRLNAMHVYNVYSGKKVFTLRTAALISVCFAILATKYREEKRREEKRREGEFVRILEKSKISCG